jgi:hypothetical protein
MYDVDTHAGATATAAAAAVPKHDFVVFCKTSATCCFPPRATVASAAVSTERIVADK